MILIWTSGRSTRKSIMVEIMLWSHCSATYAKCSNESCSTGVAEPYWKWRDSARFTREGVWAVKSNLRFVNNMALFTRISIHIRMCHYEWGHVFPQCEVTARRAAKEESHSRGQASLSSFVWSVVQIFISKSIGQREREIFSSSHWHSIIHLTVLTVPARRFKTFFGFPYHGYQSVNIYLLVHIDGCTIIWLCRVADTFSCEHLIGRVFWLTPPTN